jgi:hypothetical protein
VSTLVANNEMCGTRGRLADHEPALWRNFANGHHIVAPSNSGQPLPRRHKTSTLLLQIVLTVVVGGKNILRCHDKKNPDVMNDETVRIWKERNSSEICFTLKIIATFDLLE